MTHPMQRRHAITATLAALLTQGVRADNRYPDKPITLNAFAPINTLGFFDIGIFVASKSKFNALREVVAAAKAQPGKLTVGTIAVGSTQHLAAEMFKTVTGIDVVIVPYKGSPAVLTALLSGEVLRAAKIEPE